MWTFFQCDSKNWTFFFKKKKQLKELNLFWIWRKEFNPFFLTMTQRIQPSFLEYDAKNWTSFFNVTLRIEPLFSDITKRIEPFSFRCNSKNWIFNNDSKNWTLLKICFTLRFQPFIEPFHMSQIIFSGSKNWFFFRKYALKNWTFFYMTQRIEPSSEHMTFKIWTSFFFSMTQRIEPFFWIRFTELNPFVKYDSKNWTLFFKKKIDSKNWTF